jgi:hypothetical protein
MAKWNGKSVKAIELSSDESTLPWYGKGYAGQVMRVSGVHLNSGGYPVFVSSEVCFEDGHFYFFNESHVRRFVYEGVSQ